MTFDTVQVDSVDANAGLQQTVNVSDGGSSIFPDQSGTGWAPTVGTSTTATTTTTPNWGFYLVMIALAWFAYKKWGG